MPTIRPLNLNDFWVRTFNTGQSVQTPGQVFTIITAKAGGLTTAGSALGTGTAAAVTWIAVGTGSGTPGVGDTALFTELARAPVLTSDGSGVLQLVQAVFGAVSALGFWTELGVFSGGSATPGSGTLLAHVMLIPPVAKTPQKIAIVEFSAQ